MRCRNSWTNTPQAVSPIRMATRKSFFFFKQKTAYEILGLELRFLQAEVDRADGKRGVVLAPRQPLLLHRADRNPVDDESRGRVVVVGRDAEDAHQYWLLASGSARDGANPSGSRRAARRARKTKGGSSTKYWTRRMSEPITPASAAATRRYAFHSLPSRACQMRRRVRGPAMRVSCACE